MSAKAADAEDAISDGEVGDPCSDCGDLTGQLATKNAPMGSA
jgi:hypothetical protein